MQSEKSPRHSLFCFTLFNETSGLCPTVEFLLICSSLNKGVSAQSTTSDIWKAQVLQWTLQTCQINSAAHKTQQGIKRDISKVSPLFHFIVSEAVLSGEAVDGKLKASAASFCRTALMMFHQKCLFVSFGNGIFPRYIVLAKTMGLLISLTFSLNSGVKKRSSISVNQGSKHPFSVNVPYLLQSRPRRMAGPHPSLRWLQCCPLPSAPRQRLIWINLNTSLLFQKYQ